MWKKVIGLAMVSGLFIGGMTAYADNANTAPISTLPVTVINDYGLVLENNHIHRGLDVAMNEDVIYSPINGIVEDVAQDDGGEYTIIITNRTVGDSIVLANLQSCSFKKGDTINERDVIGNATGDVIHVEYWPKGFNHGEPSNPAPFLSLNGTFLDWSVAQKA